uniref:Uncharacterized protein n=1 Tax=Tetranychus urticae TaxID=32264 RepID=T1K6Z2_TETUR
MLNGGNKKPEPNQLDTNLVHLNNRVDHDLDRINYKMKTITNNSKTIYNWCHYGQQYPNNNGSSL